MQKALLIIAMLVSASDFFLVAPTAKAASNDTIIFLHHSTGAGVWSGGNVPSWFDNYNNTHSTSYVLAERWYPAGPYSHPDDNYPFNYWDLWIHGSCNSSYAGSECMNTLTQSYTIIIYKHCFPGADVVADNGTPDVGSSVQTLANYKLQYRALRLMMDSYPNTKFIVWTLAPLRQADTTADNAARARQFVDWVKNNWLSEDGNTHPNIFIFDFWGLVAGSDNFLLDAYENGVDSHPNALANAAVGPIFSQFIVDTANAPIGHVAPPAAPMGLTVQ